MKRIFFLTMALAVSGLAVGLSSGVPVTTKPATTKPAAATRPASIAARYPGDKGIEKDPAVILHENFEDAKIYLDKFIENLNLIKSIKSSKNPMELTTVITKLEDYAITV